MQKQPIVQVVAAALKRRMVERGIPSANRLGELAKVAPNTVSNFLNPGKREPSANGKVPSGKLTELEMICDALAIDVAHLLSGSPDELPPPQIRDKVLALTREEFSSVYDTLEPPELETLTRLMAAAGFLRGKTVEVIKCSTTDAQTPSELPGLKVNKIEKPKRKPRQGKGSSK